MCRLIVTLVVSIYLLSPLVWNNKANASPELRSYMTQLANEIKWARGCNISGTIQELALLHKRLLESLTYPAVDYYRKEYDKRVGNSLKCEREVVDDILKHGQRWLFSEFGKANSEKATGSDSSRLSEDDITDIIATLPDEGICAFSTKVENGKVLWDDSSNATSYKDEAARRGLECGVAVISTVTPATSLGPTEALSATQNEIKRSANAASNRSNEEAASLILSIPQKQIAQPICYTQKPIWEHGYYSRKKTCVVNT